MKRTPLVLGGTVAGLVGVLMFRTTPSPTSFTTLPGTSGTSAAAGTAAAPPASASARAGSAKHASVNKTSGSRTSGSQPSGKASGSRASGTKTGSAAPRATAPASPVSSPSASPASGPRSATGAAVNYSWGVLAVRVTVSGKKITKVAIASLDDGANPRSQIIDQQSIPLLEQEVLQAQSASIQGVSGASYTSAGFVQSLQSALTTLGV